MQRVRVPVCFPFAEVEHAARECRAIGGIGKPCAVGVIDEARKLCEEFLPPLADDFGQFRIVALGARA